MSIKELKENLETELDTYLIGAVLFYLYDYRDDFSIEEFFKAFREVFNTWANKLEKNLINDKEEN